MAKVFTKTEKIFLLFAATLALALVLMATSLYGLGVSTDGLHYLAAADNFAAGFGLVDHKGYYLDSWAPLLPTLMGLLNRLTGLSSLQAATLINLTSLVLLVWLTGYFIKASDLSSPLWFYFGTLGFSIFVSSISIASNVAAEPLFLLVTYFFFILTIRYLDSPNPATLIFMAVVVAFAPILRWVGVSLIFAGVAILLVKHWSEWRLWIKRSFLFGIISSLPFVIWTWGRNYRLTGTFVGPRQTQVDFAQPLENLSLFYARITEWWLPNYVSKRVNPLLIIGVVLLFMVVVNAKKDWVDWKRRVSKGSVLAPGIFALIYFVFMVLIVATREHMAQHDDRYLLPILLPLLLFVFISVDRLLLPPLKQRWKGSLVSLIVVLSIWIAYQGFLTYRFIEVSLDEGVPYYNIYNLERYRQSDFIEAMESFPFESNVPLYSNDASAVYFYTGRQVNNSPSMHINFVASRENITEHIESWPLEVRAYLIWVLPNWKDNYFSPDQLDTVSLLEPLTIMEEGELFLASPR